MIPPSTIPFTPPITSPHQRLHTYPNQRTYQTPMSSVHAFIPCSAIFPSHQSLRHRPFSSKTTPFRTVIARTTTTCKTDDDTSINNHDTNHHRAQLPAIDVTSVNYFISRVCNYKCKFCFHTAKNSHILSSDDAKRGLRLLRQAGTQKINFAGGEPFIHPVMLGELCKESHNLGMAVSIISNGSLVTPEWMRLYGTYVDIFGVSVDSFDSTTNAAIGRGGDAINHHVQHVFSVRELCDRHDIMFKMNTVVCALNWTEDLCDYIRQLDPMRWKVFQCLILKEENAGLPGELRDATKLVVTEHQFNAFLHRHAEFKQMVPESNDVMQNSYLMLDEYMRFLDCSSGGKAAGPSILDVGVHEAVGQSGFDIVKFEDRGGVYEWKMQK